MSNNPSAIENIQAATIKVLEGQIKALVEREDAANARIRELERRNADLESELRISESALTEKGESNE